MKSNGLKKKFEYVFHWYFYTAKSVELFRKFKKLCAVTGDDCSEVLEGIMGEYVDRHFEHSIKGREIVSQNEMLKALKENDHKTSPQSLHIWRTRGVLLDSEGRKFWYTDGTNIYYDKQRLLDFVKSRNDNPMQRLTPKESNVTGAAGISR